MFEHSFLCFVQINDGFNFSQIDSIRLIGRRIDNNNKKKTHSA